MRRRSVWWLLGSWVVYWAALAVVKLGPAFIAGSRASHAPESARNNITFGAGSDGFKLVVTEHGQTTWSGSIGVWALIAWIAVVPLALWFAWFIAARSDVPGSASSESASRVSS